MGGMSKILFYSVWFYKVSYDPYANSIKLILEKLIIRFAVNRYLLYENKIITQNTFFLSNILLNYYKKYPDMFIGNARKMC